MEGGKESSKRLEVTKKERMTAYLNCSLIESMSCRPIFSTSLTHVERHVKKKHSTSLHFVLFSVCFLGLQNSFFGETIDSAKFNICRYLNRILMVASKHGHSRCLVVCHRMWLMRERAAKLSD